MEDHRSDVHTGPNRQSQSEAHNKVANRTMGRHACGLSAHSDAYLSFCFYEYIFINLNLLQYTFNYFLPIE